MDSANRIYFRSGAVRPFADHNSPSQILRPKTIPFEIGIIVDHYIASCFFPHICEKRTPVAKISNSENDIS
jgi:hypothetical protein